VNNYLLGCDVLGAELVGDLGPASIYDELDVALGELGFPSILGAGDVYTDKETITAVQKKLAAIGYFRKTVDGVYGPDTEAALFLFSGQHGPPNGAVIIKLFSGQNGPADPALLKRLGLSPSSGALPPLVSAPSQATPAPASSALPPLIPPPSQATIDAAVAAAKQASQAQTAPQAQAAATQMAVAAAAPNVPPEVKAQAVQVQKEAAQAVTPAQVEVVKEKLQVVAEAIRTANKPGMAPWKIAAIAGGSAVGVGLLVWLITSMSHRSAGPR
jgi:peptidoglycan hydrolase-like protein with peptidoglycan-binding domain